MSNPAETTERERRFTEQSEEFLVKAGHRFPDAPRNLDRLLNTPPRPLDPVLVRDLMRPTPDESARIAAELAQGYGAAHVVPLGDPYTPAPPAHPLHALALALSEKYPLGHPVDHPMERHPESIARFGEPDGTLKLYNLPIAAGVDKYREQGETNQLFDSHNDGLGYAGLIRTSVMHLDSSPITGGYTYFQNLVRVAPALAAADAEAFRALFLPDAITALRPRGKGAIEVTSPVFFLGRDGSPQIFFRVSTGEYVITWRAHPALQRARELLNRLAAPFGPDGRFVHFMTPGETVVVDNRSIVHGRTAFVDPEGGTRRGRVLARKWFVATPEDAVYRHVPGMEVQSSWANLFPERFTGAAISGEWHYDAALAVNRRLDQ